MNIYFISGLGADKRAFDRIKLDKDFYLGNVLKYLARAGKKSFNKKEDLEKALVYLQRRIDTL